jgi:hypothetical protein
LNSASPGIPPLPCRSFNQLILAALATREAAILRTAGWHPGPREQIFYGEFDGRRRKRVLVMRFIKNLVDGDTQLAFKGTKAHFS